MADLLKHTSKDDRGRWQYRRHIPKPLRHLFHGRREFVRALPEDSKERAQKYLAVAAEFDAIAAGRDQTQAKARIVLRANAPDAPPLSAEALQINASLPPEGEAGEEGHPDPDPPPSVADAVKLFAEDPLRASTEKTKGAHRPRLATLCVLLGPDKPIGAVTKEEFRAAVKMLYEIPREYHRKYAAKGIGPSEAIERGKARKPKPEPTLSPKSVQHYIETWRSFFAWAENEDLILSSPAKALKAPKVKRNREREDAWTTTEGLAALNALFAAELFQGHEQRVARPGEFWVPMISLIQGLRLAEAVLLVKADLIEVAGIPCFDIRERPGRSIKNEPSQRIVPVSDRLIELGLLDHVRALPSPSSPMWPDLMVGKRGKPLKDPPDMYGKRAFTEQVKAAQADGPGRVFHALRHAFATHCRAARMPDSARLYLGGWAQIEGVASSYGKQDIPALKEELDAVKYAGVMLPSAYPIAHSEGEFVQPVATRIRATP